MATASDFEFTTVWELPAPVARVWDELLDIDAWPTWWRGFERVDVVREGDANGVGNVRDLVTHGRLPYRLRYRVEVVRVEPLRLIEARSTGDLEGFGRWTTESTDGGTRAVYLWHVRTTNRILRALSPLARGTLTRNHDRVMEWGRQGILERLGTTAEAGAAPEP
ncbi:SRPBCC family protein [Agromyces sp. NPDC004153]